MKVSVIGSGYVGLVTAACLADLGNDVLGLDIDEARIAELQQGRMPIFEPGLADLVRRNAAAGRLRFTASEAESARHGRVQFIAVGTPQGPDGSADLAAVFAAARGIGRHAERPAVVVDKSTVPVGTSARVGSLIDAELAARGLDLRLPVVSNPEFLKEGAALEDFMRPDRIVVGGDDAEAIATMRELYAPFERNHSKLMVMDAASAELTKYAANAMLATRISFMNEIARIADATGADIDAVRRGIGGDRRIGSHFLYAGCGYGGSCFPKDLRALSHAAAAAGIASPLLGAVEAVNERQKRVLIEKIDAAFDADVAGRTFALWGLAFKPGTDDMRDAPSVVVARALVERGAWVVAYDPVAGDEARRVFAGVDAVSFAASALAALRDADALVVVTEWKEFRGVEPEAIAAAMRGRHVFDGRNIFDPMAVRRAGLRYVGIGRR